MGRAGYNGGGGGGGWARHPKEDGTYEKPANRGPLADLGEGPQRYLSLIQEYGSRRNQGRDAQYKFLAKALVHHGAEAEHVCRTSVVEFFEDRATHTEFKNAIDLQSHLDSSHPNLATSRRRLFIVEDLSVKTVCLLGSYLLIHPSVRLLIWNCAELVSDSS